MSISLIQALILLDEREVLKSCSGDLDCFEATRKNVAIAHKLAGQILGRGRLALQEKVLLLLIEEMVGNKREWRFSRERVREYTGWSRRLLKTHIDRLEEMKYLRRENRLYRVRRIKKDFCVVDWSALNGR